MTNAVETIKEIIRHKVNVLNYYRKDADHETFERIRHELTGMLVCLKNVNDDDKFYSFNYYEDKVEFGYYNADGKWVIIA